MMWCCHQVCVALRQWWETSACLPACMPRAAVKESCQSWLSRADRLNKTTDAGCMCGVLQVMTTHHGFLDRQALLLRAQEAFTPADADMLQVKAGAWYPSGTMPCIGQSCLTAGSCELW